MKRTFKVIYRNGETYETNVTATAEAHDIFFFEGVFDGLKMTGGFQNRTPQMSHVFYLEDGIEKAYCSKFAFQTPKGEQRYLDRDMVAKVSIGFNKRTGRYVNNWLPVALLKAKDINQIGAKSTHIFEFCDATSDEAIKLSMQIEECSARRHAVMRDENMPNAEKGKRYKELWDEYRYLIKKLNRFKTRENIVHNITTTAGRSVFAQILGGDNTYSGNVNYTALGSDNTTPTISDATLGTETTRKVLSSGTDASNVSYIETFFSASEAVATHEEYGMFIDGTATANTGQLFNRFIATNAKSATETMNVQSVVTWNDA